MRTTILFIILLALGPAPAWAGESASIESLKASAFVLPPAGLRLAPPAPVPPDLVARFNAAAGGLRRLDDDIRWVKNDMANLEERARQIIQLHVSDLSFQDDLRRMSDDTSRRLAAIQNSSADVRNLVAAARRAPELNAIARDMERDARSILSTAWPGMEDAAGRLEGTIQSGTPEVIGYDSQWMAADISRGCRDFSTQARRILSDAQVLVRQTQP